MQNGIAMRKRHVIEAMGKTKVVIEDGKVVSVGKPAVIYCPLFMKHRGIEEITSEIVRENVEFRMRDFGMCGPTRKMRMKDFLTYGVSELLAMAVAQGTLDSAVLVTDGAGTVVVTDPELIQGIGGRISGVIETTPIAEVIQAVGRENVLDPEKGSIDQFSGTQLAFKLGHRKVGVTVARADDARMIRDGFGSSVMLFAVHTTGADQRDARLFFETCDIVSACASRWVREESRSKALLQVGNKIPIYAASEAGKRLLEARIAQLGGRRESGPEDAPRPLL
ncbi:MAG TPA: methanogenesis marker 8 protein [Methanomassiliicoccales archaeon]|nr:methanogenesis marker 8 protein [Methanomassiliicoccales archaeon]